MLQMAQDEAKISGMTISSATLYFREGSQACHSHILKQMCYTAVSSQACLFKVQVYFQLVVAKSDLRLCTCAIEPVLIEP